MGNSYGIETCEPYKIKDTADAVLAEWDDICISLGIPHCLLFGTCLGFYRDGGYILHDNDIDVGALISIDSPIFMSLVESLIEHEFVVGSEFDAKKHFYKDRVLLDLWCYPTLADSSHLLCSFDLIRYGDRVYNLPHPVEEYLEMRYDTWHIPAKNI